MEETYVITTDGIMKKDEASGSVVREISTKEEIPQRTVSNGVR